MTFFCDPHVTELVPLTRDAGLLGRRVKMRRGRWALIKDGEIEVRQGVTQEQVDAADLALRGGYMNVVDEQTKDLIVEAGYPEWITEA